MTKGVLSQTQERLVNDAYNLSVATFALYGRIAGLYLTFLAVFFALLRTELAQAAGFLHALAIGGTVGMIVITIIFFFGIWKASNFYFEKMELWSESEYSTALKNGRARINRLLIGLLLLGCSALIVVLVALTWLTKV